MKPKAVSSEACVSKLKVLADPTRLAVIRLLMEAPRHVGELARGLQVEQSLLSHHLRVLREAGLVVATPDGKAVLYGLAQGIKVSGCGPGIDIGCCRLTFD